MSLKGILNIVGSHPEFRRHLREIDTTGRPAPIAVRQGARPAYLAALWSAQQVPVLVLTPRPADARRFHDQLLTYLGEDAPVHLLPEAEVLPFERLAVDTRTSNQRLSTLDALASCVVTDRPEKPGQSPLVISSVAAALRWTLSPLLMRPLGSSPGSYDVLKVGQRVPRTEELLSRWVELGYRHEPLVESPGTFSQRGGIIDVYPPHYELPLRIELWDDEIDTIRSFDLYTQRSVEAMEVVDIIPAQEQLPNLVDRSDVDRLVSQMDLSSCTREVRERIEDDLVYLFSDPDMETLHFYNGLLNHSSILDYFPLSGLMVLDRIGQIEAEALEQEEKYTRMRDSREERGELPRNFPSPYLAWNEFSRRLSKWEGRQAHLESWLNSEADPIFSPATPYYGQLGQFTSDVQRQQQTGNITVVVSQHSRGRIAELLEEADVAVAPSEGIEEGEPPESGRAYLVHGSLNEGLSVSYQDGHLAGSVLLLLTDAELFGTVKERRYRPSRRKHDASKDVALADLVPGSYVVHVDHGVARFAGTTRM